MDKSETLKQLGTLEMSAIHQENLIETIKKDLKQQQDELHDIIARMRGLIRDDQSGQEGMNFDKENG